MSNEPDRGRRRFLKMAVAAGAGLIAVGAGWALLRPGTPVVIQTEMKGANAILGHRLRSGVKRANTAPERHVPVLIVGGGIAGLSAAWYLSRQTEAIRPLILELEKAAGGNSAYDQNAVSAYPWGAHYLPVPDPEDKLLRELLTDLDIITDNSGELPVYDPYAVCFAPQERLFIHGSWQSGLVPQLGVPEAEQKQITAFFEWIAELRAARGADGKYAFAIPILQSSADAQYRDWDRIPFRKLLDEKGFDSPHLRWYLDYCCRDDYGTSLEDTSAWAGLHYFAGRRGQGANVPLNENLTWPEGNGRLVRLMLQRAEPEVLQECLVHGIRQEGDKVLVDFLQGPENRPACISADQVICCTPRFITQRIFPHPDFKADPDYGYAPWVVANVTLSKRPEGRGAPLSWENIPYDSESLGYVVADHQEVRGFDPPETVLTWYMALKGAPAEARRQAYDRTEAEWKDIVIADLERMHHGIREQVRRIDFWIWGHAMIRPVPGFIYKEGRQAHTEPLGRVHFAHSDLSGISIFEEAFHHGVRAASEVMQGRSIS